ncbi:MAG: hypothetical protein E7673_05805 [Ruminococcaceae bacterium]|nr:hypothetical protein [Oscillospiraceae bacterium]
MLYDKWNKKEFSEELFKNPTSEFRGAPFWAWNSKLDPEVLRDQVDLFREMGFGGFHMHVRQGLETEYLGEDFFKAVRACTERAEENEMLAWLYDEDRWPSGAAGGFVTKKIKNRVKALALTYKKRDNAVRKWQDAVETGAPVFLAAFSLNVNENGILTSYERVSEDAECENKAYFYCVTARGGEPRYNYQSYVDALSKSAIDDFKEITYEAFKREIGDKFGSIVPAIFTDEPQVNPCNTIKSGHDKRGANIAWTWDFPETFQKAYGFDITERLPEIYFKCEDESDRSPRYFYYRHLSERFSEAFLDNLGAWCGENGIMLTGHMMCEDNLLDEAKWSFDPMRSYKNMQLPGIDVLRDRRLFATAKQCESVVRQMGRAGMMSELYGVTGWDYDFRGHKLQGDWQACLGVTVRVPHLAWQTMKGEGKRDYPACIYYQSPWYKEYKIVEDHFARVNTALTRGNAVSHVAVLHPIESFFMHYASEAETYMECEELNNQFLETCNWLLTGSVNFDYIAESLLEDLCKNPTCPLTVGEMQYDVILLDNCENLRPNTIKALEKFALDGGKIIISGKKPSMSLAKPSAEAEKLVSLASSVIPHTKCDIYKALENERDVTLRLATGALASNVIYTRRRDNDCDWLFICPADNPELLHLPSKTELEICVSGLYEPVLYDTVKAEKSPMTYIAKNGKTRIKAEIFDCDSLLIRLKPITSENSCTLPRFTAERKDIYSPSVVKYRLTEPNVLLLDMAEWSLDGGKLHAKEEILRIDEAVRKTLGLTLKGAKAVQPWAVAGESEKNEIYLKFTFNSEIEYNGAELALENLEKSYVSFNGTQVDNTPTGSYVDREIHKCALPKILKGENTLEVTMPFGVRTDVENCFVLGDFGVSYRGREAFITERPEDLAYGDITRQNLAFYSANVVYDSEFELDEDSSVEFEISYYRGALVRVDVDGKPMGYIWKSPFRLVTEPLHKGVHKVSYTLFGNRYNTFSALHHLGVDKKGAYMGPIFWRSQGFEWSYEYNTRPMGILKTPIVRKYKKVFEEG